jgi:Leucine-rich repeat (LRR) protein
VRAQVEEKRRTMLLQDVDSLAFSFHNLVKIDNLAGINSLRKLKLDCNRLTRIENLDHLVCWPCRQQLLRAPRLLASSSSNRSLEVSPTHSSVTLLTHCIDCRQV